MYQRVFGWDGIHTRFFGFERGLNPAFGVRQR